MLSLPDLRRTLVELCTASSFALVGKGYVDHAQWSRKRRMRGWLASLKAFERAFRTANFGGFLVWQLVHGRMKPEEKQLPRWTSFAQARKRQVLVSTTVVEVGVDVPNASLMVIASPERFGLSQLHQLRGRVGRGVHAGVCGLLCGADIGDTQRERLEAFTKTTDGFELAELDFNLRGPGDLFDVKQSGLPPLRIADLRRDRDVLQKTREAARELFESDPGLKDPEHAALRRQMLRRYGNSLDLGDVG